jgi:hypothetical protein
MKTSETIVKIIPALLKCQQKIEAVSKTADNPFFHSKYADLNSLMDACKDILNSNDLLILQPIDCDSVETIVFHTSGEWVSSSTKIVAKTDTNPQDQGSAISYARRYGLQSMLFMSAEDDDGEKATSHASSTPPKQTNVSKPTQVSNEVCATCGEPTTYKEGVNKTGKKWGGYFCTNKDHVPKWVAVKQPEDIPDLVINPDEVDALPF